MGFRYYRRLNVLPGILLNLGKKGASVSGGTRGARMTFGSRGVKSSVGSPGTGIRYETSYSKCGRTSVAPGGGSSSDWLVAMAVLAVASFMCFKSVDDVQSPIVRTLVASFFGVATVVCLVKMLLVAMTYQSPGVGGSGKKTSTYTAKQHALAVRQGHYIDDMIDAARAFYDFLRELDRSARCRNHLKSFPGMEPLDAPSSFTINQRLALIVYCDIQDCYAELGHDPARLSGLEGAAYAMLVILLINRGFDLQNFKDTESRKELLRIVGELYYTAQAEINIYGHEDEYRFAFLFGTAKGEREWVQRYATLMYRWASLIAKADGKVTEYESSALASILEMKDEKSAGDVRISSREAKAPRKEKTDESVRTLRDEPQDEESLDSVMSGLDALIGLEPVKKEVHQLADFIGIRRKRQSMGMKNAPVSYHCVFTGNPGTGKTTVARILAEVYRAMGVVKKGHLVAPLTAEMLSELTLHDLGYAYE